MQKQMFLIKLLFLTEIAIDVFIFSSLILVSFLEMELMVGKVRTGRESGQIRSKCGDSASDQL